MAQKNTPDPKIWGIFFWALNSLVSIVAFWASEVNFDSAASKFFAVKILFCFCSFLDGSVLNESETLNDQYQGT